jgi:hypothetical protein
LFFRASLTGGEDEDEEAQEERREHGKALLAKWTDPHGGVALRVLGVQKPGYSPPYPRGVDKSRQRPASTIVRRGARNIRNIDHGLRRS